MIDDCDCSGREGDRIDDAIALLGVWGKANVE